VRRDRRPTSLDLHQRAAQIAAARPAQALDLRQIRVVLRATICAVKGMLMHWCATTGRRWISLFAAVLFVFQALIASSALAAPRSGAGSAGATTIICTASGPRVVSLDIAGADQGEQHSGALPHCCVAGCAMLGGATLPELWLLAWLLPTLAQPDAAAPAVVSHFSSAVARLQQQPRAPPHFA